MTLGNMGAAHLPVAQRPNPGNLRYGLFNVAPPQTLVETDDGQNLTEHAYGGGMYYDAMGCGRARAYEINCAPGGKTFDDNSAETLVLPFVVYATLKCGPRGMTPAYMIQKTSERLYASEQHAVEAAFWAGGFANAPIIATVGATNVAGAGLSFATITEAVAALEDFAYSTVPYGFNAVLHAKSAVHAYAASEHLVVTAAQGYAPVWGTDNNERMLRTPLGTKWSFGGGYPGTAPVGEPAPAAGQTYIFITGNVSVWRQPEWAPPDPLRTMDRAINEYRLLAERGYLATRDCFTAYALVDIPKVAT